MNNRRKAWRMRDLQIPQFTPDDGRTAPLYQDDVYVIMWRSERSGGTYSIIRKSEEGMRRYVYALELVGWSKDQIKVFTQHKPWVPVKKSEEPKKHAELPPPREGYEM